MSKIDKPVKPNFASQLRKDVNQAGKVIQNLANSLERLENAFSEAETVLSNEGIWKEKLLAAQEEITRLKEAHSKLQNETQGKIASFADANLELVRVYNARVARLMMEHELKLKECQQREAALEFSWKKKLEVEKSETHRLKEAERYSKTEIEGQLRKAKEKWERKEEQLQAILRQREGQIAELSAKNKTSMDELHEHQTMLKGRDTEMNRVRSRLAALEAFPSEEVTEKLSDVIAKLQATLREFCVWCFDSAEVLPWNHFPTGLRYRHLPRSYSSQSASGRYVFLAAIQHSICTVMTENFRPPIGPYADRGFWAISEALLQSNESHEAIWRLMTVNAILNDQRMVDGYKANLQEVAKRLLSSWSPFPGDSQKGETLERLTQLLIDSAMIFLDLQKVQKRIHVSVEVVSQYFESDSEEDLHNVPGGFELPDSTAAVLCLFPAFFWTTSSGATVQTKLLRKGTAMFRDSPPLLAALNEEQEAMSPSKSNRRRPTD